jgi:hypothetical protein
MSERRTDGRHSRRRFLGLVGAGAGVVVGGVAARQLLDGAVDPTPPGVTNPPGPVTTRPGGPVTTAAPPTTAAPEPTAAPYVPLAGEVQVEAKLVAARFVEALSLYTAGEAADGPVERAMGHAVEDLDAGLLAERARPLFHPDTSSAGQIVYPQLGGLDPHADPVRGSVMVVVEQHLRSEAGERRESRCVDVRVRRDGGVWRVDGLEDASGDPVERPAELPEAAARVLDHEAISLPDSARWDIHEGVVTEPVLGELALLADRTPVAVTSFRRGHPFNVYGTSRRSGHMTGRAVDIWAVGGVPVVEQQPATDTALHTVARDVHEAGRVTNFGAPWAFDGVGGRSFTDPVHHDHLHLGIV